MIDILTKYEVVLPVCPPFSSQNIRKSGNVFNKGNFMMFCCHGNAINFKLLLCFLSCWVY